MKSRLVPLLLAGILLSSSLSAQVTLKKRIPPDEREIAMEELYNLEKENARAIQLNNPSFFQAAYADEFTGVTWYGVAINKPKLIQLIQTSDVKYSSVTASDIRPTMYLDAASVLSLRTERATIKGKRVDRQFRVLRVYVYTPRGWKVISQLETQLPSVLQQR
jgi:Domain of unknown function (DUF4440)